MGAFEAAVEAADMARVYGNGVDIIPVIINSEDTNVAQLEALGRCRDFDGVCTDYNGLSVEDFDISVTNIVSEVLQAAACRDPTPVPSPGLSPGPSPGPTPGPTEQGFFCHKPANCNTNSCDIVGGCGPGIPAGYYPDLTNCNSYCKCTGTTSSARYETCNSGLQWDSFQQGTVVNEYLPAPYGEGDAWATNGGACGRDYDMSSEARKRPPGTCG